MHSACALQNRTPFLEQDARRPLAGRSLELATVCRSLAIACHRHWVGTPLSSALGMGVRAPPRAGDMGRAGVFRTPRLTRWRGAYKTGSADVAQASRINQINCCCPREGARLALGLRAPESNAIFGAGRAKAARRPLARAGYCLPLARYRLPPTLGRHAPLQRTWHGS